MLKMCVSCCAGVLQATAEVSASAAADVPMDEEDAEEAAKKKQVGGVKFTACL
jgi:hypothetical protein